MTWQDVINSLLKMCATPFILCSIMKLYREKKVHGISWVHTGFFVIWGYWGLYYFLHLEQYASFCSGVLIVIANTIWLIQLIYYSRVKS
jgi:hypothetical protein